MSTHFFRCLAKEMVLAVKAYDGVPDGGFTLSRGELQGPAIHLWINPEHVGVSPCGMGSEISAKTLG